MASFDNEPGIFQSQFIGRFHRNRVLSGSQEQGKEHLCCSLAVSTWRAQVRACLSTDEVYAVRIVYVCIDQ